MNVILSSPIWSLNGINSFSINLVRGLQSQGIHAQILITRPDWIIPQVMPVPDDISFGQLPVGKYASWFSRWRAMRSYLEEQAPCIYFPNFDFWHSCVSPKLSNRVMVVGIVHSDDPQHYEHVTRLGGYWNAIVAVSEEIAGKVIEIDSSFGSRLETIPYGVEIPASAIQKTGNSNEPLKIVYVGRFDCHQKRILDIPEILNTLAHRGIQFRMSLIGGGSDEVLLKKKISEMNLENQIHFTGALPQEQVKNILEESDVFLLTSAFEGMPISLLEAMANGCIPVVSRVRSGIPEIVNDGVNGYVLDIGDIHGFADRLERLALDLYLRQEYAQNAYNVISSGIYHIETMVQNYLKIFDEIENQFKMGKYFRPVGRILPPGYIKKREYLPGFVQATGSAILRRMKRIN